MSIAIPCYEMNGLGVQFLNKCLDSISKQSFKDIEVVVSDHSLNNNILEACNTWNNFLKIKYIKNLDKRGSSSNNINNCIKNCSGELIKILCQDDFLYEKDSIKKIIDNFKTGWLVSTYIHTYDTFIFVNKHTPVISNNILTCNKIGTHSCLTIENNDVILFDENLIWFMDSEYYKRLYNKYGKPVILDEITMVQTLWRGQVTNTLATEEVRINEYLYLKEKYGDKNEKW